MNNFLRTLVDLRDRQIQKARIQFGNRISALERGTDIDGSVNEQQLQTLQRYYEYFDEIERELDVDIALAVRDEPVFVALSSIKGIGPGLSAKLIAMVDIERARTVSALWRYSGYGQGKYWIEDGKPIAMVEGWQWVKKGDKKERVRVRPEPKPGWTMEERPDRPLAGWCLPYNKRLKTALHLVATSFMRCGSPYRLVYDDAKEKYERTHPEWSKGHRHNAATRKMLKIFMSHWWVTYREIMGLPTNAPYVHAVLHHTHVYDRMEFGWSVAESVARQAA